MSDEVVIAVLALLHAVVGMLVGIRVYRCAVESQCVRRSDEEEDSI